MCAACDREEAELRARDKGDTDLQAQLRAMMLSPSVAPSIQLPSFSVLERAEVLGQGAYGVALGITRQLVVKLTTDPYEYAIAHQIIGATLKRAWYIFNAGRLQEPTRRACIKLWPFLRGNGNKRDKAGPFYIIGERLQKPKERFAVFGDRRTEEAASELNSELRAYGVQHKDTHGGNCLTRNGQPVFVDIRMINDSLLQYAERH